MPRFNLAVAAGLLLGALGFSAVVSSVASPANKYKELYSFQRGIDGAYPMSALTLDSAGNLYGTTSQGGAVTCGGSGCGTVFELERTQSGWKEKILYRFRGGDDGAFPQAGVIFSSSGKLYGTTVSGGGRDQVGTVFELRPDSGDRWAEKIIYIFSFYGDPGNSPQADLVFDAYGNLYGTTRKGGRGDCVEGDGCGGVFELSPQGNGSWTVTTLHTFDDPPDGGNPSSAVVLDSAGDVYGMTEVGGIGVCHPPNIFHFALNCGTVYKLTPRSGGSWTESITYNFDRGGGRAVYPSSSLLLDKAEDLFGTSNAGGNGIGTVFQLHQRRDGSWSQTEPHLFYGKPDGGGGGGLVMNEQGDLLAVTPSGGTNGGGTVLQLQRRKDAWKSKILHAFPYTEGGFKSGLVLDSQGHLYGTTRSGGSNGWGAIYEIVP